MATVTPFPQAPATSWERTVHTVAAKARAAFPSLGGKIEHATALVLAGAVEMPDGMQPHRYTVASQSDATGLKTYAVTCGTPSRCDCEDFTHRHEAEADFRCKHILAVWIYRRALAQQEPAPVAPAAPCPEALFSITLKGSMQGHEVLLTARGATFEEFSANVQRLQGLLDPPASQPASAPVSPPAPPTAEGWCGIHNVQMDRQSNERGSWWSHPDGTADASGKARWCRGKKAKA